MRHAIPSKSHLFAGKITRLGSSSWLAFQKMLFIFVPTVLFKMRDRHLIIGDEGFERDRMYHKISLSIGTTYAKHASGPLRHGPSLKIQLIDLFQLVRSAQMTRSVKKINRFFSFVGDFGEPTRVFDRPEFSTETSLSRTFFCLFNE